MISRDLGPTFALIKKRCDHNTWIILDKAAIELFTFLWKDESGSNLLDAFNISMPDILIRALSMNRVVSHTAM